MLSPNKMNYFVKPCFRVARRQLRKWMFFLFLLMFMTLILCLRVMTVKNALTTFLTLHFLYGLLHYDFNLPKIFSFMLVFNRCREARRRFAVDCLRSESEFVTFYFARNYIDLFQELKTVNKKNARN